MLAAKQWQRPSNASQLLFKKLNFHAENTANSTRNLLRHTDFRHVLSFCRWYLYGFVTCVTFERLESALRCGEQDALRSSILTSKWPHLGIVMVMFPLGSGYLVNTGLPMLLLQCQHSLQQFSLVTQSMPPLSSVVPSMRPIPLCTSYHTSFYQRTASALLGLQLIWGYPPGFGSYFIGY